MKQHHKPPGLSALVVIVFLGSSMMANAGDRPGTETGPAPMLIGLVEGAGVDTSNASLMEAARSHDDVTVRWAAVTILGELPVTEARTLFLRILEIDEERIVREAAALSLARLGDETGLAALEEFLETSTDRRSQIFLAARLAEFGHGAGYRYVVGALTAEDEEVPEVVKVDAVNALSAFLALEKVAAVPEQQPKSLLFRMASDPTAAVRGAVLLQLSMVVPEYVEIGEARSLVERLVEDDLDPQLRQQASVLVEAWQALEPESLAGHKEIRR